MNSLEIILTNNNIKPNNIELYEQAFVHRSFINENPKFKLGHNERLEFLGDSVLELIVTDALYFKYPDHSEGDLTVYRSALVNTTSIGETALNLGFNDLLKLSKGEQKDTGKARTPILADTYEAFLGALYLDLGYDKCVEWVKKTLLINTDMIVRGGLFKDAKSLVQEKAQEKLQVTPSYRVVSETGPDHDKLFVVGIYFGNDCVADGSGKSKQEAETNAAKAALTKYKWVVTD
jgi:ribonuclease-3